MRCLFTRSACDPSEGGSVSLRKLVPYAGVVVVVLSVGVLSAYAAGAVKPAKSPQATATAAASCKLATARDPGNSAAPKGVPFASSAPKLKAKKTYNIAFSQNASNNPWRL